MPENDDRSWEANRLLIHKEMENFNLQLKSLGDKVDFQSIQVNTLTTQVQQLLKIVWWGLGIVAALLTAAIWGGVQLMVSLAPLVKH